MTIEKTSRLRKKPNAGGAVALNVPAELLGAAKLAPGDDVRMGLIANGEGLYIKKAIGKCAICGAAAIKMIREDKGICAACIDAVKKQ